MVIEILVWSDLTTLPLCKLKHLAEFVSHAVLVCVQGRLVSAGRRHMTMFVSSL